MKIFTLRQEVTEELRNHCLIPENEFGKMVHHHIIEELEKQIQAHFPMTWKHREGIGCEYKVEFLAMSMEDFKILGRLIDRLPHGKMKQEIITLLKK